MSRTLIPHPTVRHALGRQAARLDAHDIEERLRRLLLAAVIEGVTIVVGIVGFTIIGYPAFGVVDAIYMTMITLTTVGYGEVIPVAGSAGAMLFTSVLLIFGVGSFAYLFSNLTAFAFEGGFTILLRRRQLKRSIEALRDHYLVCGLGETGLHVVEELAASGRPYIAIDSNADRLAALREQFEDAPAVVGDATEDAVLRAARVEYARGLIACVSSDKDNLIIVVTARLLQRSLRIIARCQDTQVKHKILAAGADQVVSPPLIGGRRLASSMVRPTAVSFFDSMVRDQSGAEMRVEGVPVSPASAFARATVGDLRGQKIPGMLILALHVGDDQWRYNPPDSERLSPGMSVIFMGTPETRLRLEALLAP